MLIVVPFYDTLNGNVFNAASSSSEFVASRPQRLLLQLLHCLDRHLRSLGRQPGRDYAVLVVEQHAAPSVSASSDGATRGETLAFAPGQLLNAGAWLARDWGYSYIVAHDLDLCPLPVPVASASAVGASSGGNSDSFSASVSVGASASEINDYRLRADGLPLLLASAVRNSNGDGTGDSDNLDDAGTYRESGHGLGGVFAVSLAHFFHINGLPNLHYLPFAPGNTLALRDSPSRRDSGDWDWAGGGVTLPGAEAEAVLLRSRLQRAVGVRRLGSREGRYARLAAGLSGEEARQLRRQQQARFGGSQSHSDGDRDSAGVGSGSASAVRADGGVLAFNSRRRLIAHLFGYELDASSDYPPRNKTNANSTDTDTKTDTTAPTVVPSWFAADGAAELNATVLAYAPLPALGPVHWVTMGADSLRYRPGPDGVEPRSLQRARLLNGLPPLAALGLGLDALGRARLRPPPHAPTAGASAQESAERTEGMSAEGGLGRGALDAMRAFVRQERALHRARGTRVHPRELALWV